MSLKKNILGSDIMKCKNCGQEMLDIKDYCVNCGAKLKSDKRGITFGGLIGMFSLIIIITIIGCYLIINYNTDKEIEPYLNNDTTEKSDK